MLGKGLESLIPPPSDKKPENGPVAAPLAVEPTEPKAASEPEAHVARPKPAPKASEAVFQVEVSKIRPNPHQPRREFDEAALGELAASIREFGIIQPVVVTKSEKETPTGTDVEYFLIAGERRLLAAKIVGLERVPAIIRIVGLERERLEMAIIENLQRENLNPIERARAFSRLQDEFRMTQREVASRLGKSREAVANTVRLLDLPSYIQDALARGDLSETHGRLLLAIPDASAQEKIFRDLVDKHLTTRELKHRVDLTKAPRERNVTFGAALSPELKMLEEKLRAELGAPVSISHDGATGKIVITFYSSEELKNIVEHLGGETM